MIDPIRLGCAMDRAGELIIVGAPSFAERVARLYDALGIPGKVCLYDGCDQFTVKETLYTASDGTDQTGRFCEPHAHEVWNEYAVDHYDPFEGTDW